MAAIPATNVRRFWFTLHRWIGASLAVLLIPISLSGALLVWHEQIEALLNPQRYAVTGAQILPPSAYLESAARTLGSGATPAIVRLPLKTGPVIVAARGRDAEGRPRLLNVYIDPPTARVLDVVDFRSTFFGFLHRFHENLTVPEYSGRAVVGWVGVGMSILALTGIWLWWPRGTGSFMSGLRWARSPRFTFNLHHLLGFWISIPLAVVSLTGIYLAFPQTGRDMMSSVAAMNPQPQRGGFSRQVAQQTALTADRALDIALRGDPNAKASVLFVPTQERGERVSAWRVQLRTDTKDEVTVMVDDRSGQASVLAPQAGDRAASWIRWIHDGSRGGPLWSVAVFLTGAFPTVFAVTGIMMWLRKRSGSKVVKESPATQLNPAE
jgi:uncharacterized iron-regulated membrane protein